jgi:hypothetical protein
MERGRGLVLIALLYPVALTLVTAGLLAFILLLFKVKLALVALVVFWFLSLGLTTVFVISRKALNLFGIQRYFCFAVAMAWLLALLQGAVLLFSPP